MQLLKELALSTFVEDGAILLDVMMFLVVGNSVGRENT